jgi:hypothetical protein
VTNLVEDHQRVHAAGRVGDQVEERRIGVPAEPLLLRDQGAGRLDHHGREIVLAAVVQLEKPLAVVEGELVQGAIGAIRDAAAREREVVEREILPAMETARQDRRLSRRQPRQPRRDGAHIRPVLAEHDHLGRRPVVDEHPGDVHLERMRKRQDRAGVQHIADRRLNPVVGVAEQRAAPAHRVVEELLAIGVPDAAALGA